ncbi:MAG: DUF2182 domain-containing protein [Pseudomonadota bacterium]
MSDAQNDDYWQGTALRRLVEDPRPLAWGGLFLVAGAGWAFLSAMATLQGAPSDSHLIRLLVSLCTVSPGDWGIADFAAATVMWSAMAFAMMLPAGAPLLSTYLDISGAARLKNMEVVSPVVLIAGYVSVWLIFALLATAVQWGLVSARALTGELALLNPVLGGTVLIGAGLWQFTPVKHDCLTKCRRPFTWFMANWRDDEAGVFKLGFQQGVFCLGCCWALMAVMFVAGLMNLAWMAVLAVLMVLEKVIPNPRPLVYGTGIALVIGGGIMFARGMGI